MTQACVGEMLQVLSIRSKLNYTTILLYLASPQGSPPHVCN